MACANLRCSTQYDMPASDLNLDDVNTGLLQDGPFQASAKVKGITMLNVADMAALHAAAGGIMGPFVHLGSENGPDTVSNSTDAVIVLGV